jgi:hypothetical protein
MSTRPVTILWLDDDLRPRNEGRTEERSRLQPWLAYLKSPEVSARISLVECQTLKEFRNELMSRLDLKPHDEGYIDVFLIDIFWRTNSPAAQAGFGDLDVAFADEKVLHLEAGAQLIGFMLNESWRKRRPAWLDAFRTRPIWVLTTMRDHGSTLGRWIEQAPLSKIGLLLKDPVERQGKLVANDEFVRWVASLAPVDYRTGNPRS